MKKFLLRAVLVLGIALGASLAVLADTIHLKDGSVIRGQIISFKNEQFTIMVGSGARGRKSQITVYMEDVDWIEFDTAPGSGDMSSNTTPTTQPQYQPPANPQPTSPQPSTTTPTNSSAAPTFFQVNVRVRADNASNGWTNSGLVVRRGQRLRITASGSVNLGNTRPSLPD